MAQVIARLSIRLPWWVPFYIFACRVWICMGFPLDLDRAAKRIIDHTKFRSFP
jgi:hypothetical protein